MKFCDSADTCVMDKNCGAYNDCFMAEDGDDLAGRIRAIINEEDAPYMTVHRIHQLLKDRGQ